MNVLFYVEPHGLRDSFFEHRDVLLQMARMMPALGSDVSSSLFCNHVLGDEVLRVQPDLWVDILQPNAMERQKIEAQALGWDETGVAQWRDLMADPNAPITKFYTRLLHRVHREDFAFDTIVCWGENQAVRQAAVDLGVQAIFLEKASFRAPFPEALLLHPVGEMPSINELRKRLRSLPADRFLPALTTVGKTDLVAAVKQPLPDRIEQVARKGRVALVAMQLADDANQILFSSFSSVSAFLDAVLPPLLAEGWQILLKPHPGARRRGGLVWDVQNRALAKWRDMADVHILPDREEPELVLPLLRQADLVISNNSSLSFEATLAGTLSAVLSRTSFAPQGAYPGLAEAMACFDDPALKEEWLEKARLAATFMLACRFPLVEQSGEALLLRLNLWRETPHDGVADLAALAWHGWPDAATLRVYCDLPTEAAPRQSNGHLDTKPTPSDVVLPLLPDSAAMVVLETLNTTDEDLVCRGWAVTSADHIPFRRVLLQLDDAAPIATRPQLRTDIRAAHKLSYDSNGFELILKNPPQWHQIVLILETRHGVIRKKVASK